MEVLNRLPAEIWEIILMDLDKSSLLATTLTCKDFYNFIYGSSEILKNYRLRNSYDPLVKKFVDRFGSSFRDVVLNKNSSYGKHWAPSSAIKFLTSLKHVTFLSLNDEFFNFNTMPDFKMDFPALKYLELLDKACTSRITTLFRDVKLRELKLSYDSFYQNCLDDEFLNWMCGQNQLTSLSVGSKSFYVLFGKIDLTKITFKLRSLKINLKDNAPVKIKYIEKFSEFMRNQEEIEEIHVLIDRECQHKVFLMIYNDLIVTKKLKTFEIHQKNYRKFKIPATLGTNNKVEHFTNDSIQHYDLIKYFPLLKKYEDNYVLAFGSILRELSNNCPDLEVLKMKIKTDWSIIYDKLNLNNLREIHFLNCNEPLNFWKKIVDGAPAVEKLVLHHFRLDCGSLSYMASKWLNLKELHLGCGHWQNPVLFTHLDNSESFRKLVISKSTIDRCTFENVNYRIYFYENGRERWKHWDDKKKYDLSPGDQFFDENNFEEFAKRIVVNDDDA